MIKPRCVILSAEIAGREYNDVYTYRMQSALEGKGYSFIKVLGCYKGTQEESFLVIASEDETLDYLKDLATKFEQESILIVNDDVERSADLWFAKTNELQRAGYMRPIDASRVKYMDAWTLVGNEFFGVI
jgi:hypothetical protein